MSFLVDSFACGAEQVVDLLYGLQGSQLVRTSLMATSPPRFPCRPRCRREEPVQHPAVRPCNGIRSPFLRCHNRRFRHHLLCDGVRFHNVLRSNRIEASAFLKCLPLDLNVAPQSSDFLVFLSRIRGTYRTFRITSSITTRN